MHSFRLALRPRTTLRIAAAAGIVSALSLTVQVRAAGFDETVPTQQTITELEQRASTASPREQCFLYTELVHAMTEKAGREIADGDTESAAASLKLINQYAHMIHMSLARDTKRLKNAEELMHHTTYKLAQYMHLVSGDDKATVQATLAQLDKVNDELLNQVFSH